MERDAESPQAGTRMLVEIGAGTIEGRCDKGICRFLGVPYAAPPVGANRFLEPQPVEAWPGARDATRPGAIAPQRFKEFPEIDAESLIGRAAEGGEDYLTANIWAP